jgi:hypothetical protein
MNPHLSLSLYVIVGVVGSMLYCLLDNGSDVMQATYLGLYSSYQIMLVNHAGGV